MNLYNPQCEYIPRKRVYTFSKKNFKHAALYNVLSWPKIMKIETEMNILS